MSIAFTSGRRLAPWSALLLVPLWATAQSGHHASIHQVELEAGHADPPPSAHAPRVLRPLPRQRQLDVSVVGFLPYWTSESHWQAMPLDLLSQVCWFSLELNSSGGVANAHGWPQAALTDSLHTHGVELLLCATLFGSSTLRTLLANPAARQAARANLLSRMASGSADGLMIDFEGVPGDQYGAFGTFMSEVRADLDAAAESQNRRYTLMVCTPAVDWNGAYNYSLLSTVCDALFIMAYDYHYAGSSTSGPVSPAQGWGSWNVAWSVADHLAWNGQRPEKLVLGLPWYGYDWPCQSASAGSSTTGSATARSYAAALALAQSHGLRRESVAQTPWSAWQSGSWRQCWFDDTLSLGMKLDLVQDNGLQGMGLWALGYEGSRQELWHQICARHWQETPPPPPPEEPWALRLQVVGNQVLLEWNAQPGATSYRVYGAARPFSPPREGELLEECEETHCLLPREMGTRCFRVTALGDRQRLAGLPADIHQGRMISKGR